MGWWSDTDDEDETSMSLYDISMPTPTGFLGITLGDPGVTTSNRRVGQGDLYGSFSTRPYGVRQRNYSSWITPLLEYIANQIARIKHYCSPRRVKRMTRRFLRRLGRWILEIEMGFVWGVAGISIFIFVFAAIWYIDPALLTLVLRFKQAECTTVSSAFLIGVSNCSWTSCKLGCTRDVYKCWQVQVEFEFVEGAPVYSPPWASLSTFDRGGVHNADYSDEDESQPASTARLYPNVRGCGYPPELNCEKFYEDYMNISHTYTCYVSTMDTSIAMTALDLERAKEEVVLSLIPLLIFIVFILYAFCRHGVFTICNPLRACGCHRADEIRAGAGGGVDDERTGEVAVDPSISPLSPKTLLEYKRGAYGGVKKSVSLIDGSCEDMDDIKTSIIPPTIEEGSGDEDMGTVKVTSQSSSSNSNKKDGNRLIHQKSSNSILLPTNASLTSIDEPQNNFSLSQSHSTSLYTNDIHTSGESRRRRNKRNTMSDTNGFNGRITPVSGIQPSREATKAKNKEKDFLVHRLSDDQLELHRTPEGYANDRNTSASASTLRPSSNMNINNIFGEDDVEMVVLAGEAHEDNKTVIDDISRRNDLPSTELSKPYHDLDLDLSIFGDKASQPTGQNFHLGMDLKQFENNSLKTKDSNMKGNRHSSYINDVMNLDVNNPQHHGKLQRRSTTPDSLDSFNFLPDLNEVGGDKGKTKNTSTPSDPKHIRTSRHPVASEVKERPSSIEGGIFDTDSFLDL